MVKIRLHDQLQFSKIKRTNEIRIPRSMNSLSGIGMVIRGLKVYSGAKNSFQQIGVPNIRQNSLAWDV